MNHYIVNLYREMRLIFTGIDADTPQAAAAIAHDKQTGDADNVEDCDGDDLAALVDVAGDEDYSQSVTIDFETERQRKTAPALLAALEAVLPYAETEHASLFECWRRDGESASEAEAERCGKAIDQATVAIAEAKGASIPPHPTPAAQSARFEIEHDSQENPDRAYVLVDGRFEVAIIRTETGLSIRIYPRTDGELWDDPFTTFEVDEAEILELEKEIGQ